MLLPVGLCTQSLLDLWAAIERSMRTTTGKGKHGHKILPVGVCTVAGRALAKMPQVGPGSLPRGMRGSGHLRPRTSSRRGGQTPQENGKAMDERLPKRTFLLVKVMLMLTFTWRAVYPMARPGP